MRIAALALSIALLTQPTQASDCPVAAADIKREFSANQVINLELAEATGYVFGQIASGAIGSDRFRACLPEMERNLRAQLNAQTLLGYRTARGMGEHGVPRPDIADTIKRAEKFWGGFELLAARHVARRHPVPQTRATLGMDLPRADALPSQCSAAVVLGSVLSKNTWAACDFNGCQTLNCVTDAAIAKLKSENAQLTIDWKRSCTSIACFSNMGFKDVIFQPAAKAGNPRRFCAFCPDDTRYDARLGCCR